MRTRMVRLVSAPGSRVLQAIMKARWPEDRKHDAMLDLLGSMDYICGLMVFDTICDRVELNVRKLS